MLIIHPIVGLEWALCHLKRLAKSMKRTRSNPVLAGD